MHIVFSPSKRRPGCPLLQIAYGGDVPPGDFADLFPSETWLVGPTEDMRSYPVDEEHSLKTLSTIALEAAIAQGVPVTMYSVLAVERATREEG